jgi:hypothetical protein
MAAKKSGAQRRREAKQESEKREQRLVAVTKSWLDQPGYKGTADFFDPENPPTQLPIYGIPPPLLIPTINAAVNQLRVGNFYLSSILWDGMLTDDRVYASLVTRDSALLGEPMKLDPSDESRPALKVRDATEKVISKIFPSAQLSSLRRYAWGLGVGVAQVKTTRTRKSHTPTIETWNPRYLWWDWLIRQYRITTENRGTIALDPEDDEWLIVEPFGPLGWIQNALIYPLSLPWSIRYWVRSWWARRQEVHGQPIRVGIIPADRTPADERLFLNQIGNFAHEAVVRLVQGQEGNRFDLKLLEAQSTDWQGFEKLIEHCDRSIEIAILGQSQSTEGQGGLGTQEKAGESTLMRVIRGDARVGEQLREKVLTQYAETNFGDADLAPSLTWQVDPPEDVEKKARAFSFMATGFQRLALVPDVMKMIDVRAVLEDFQLPVVAEDQVPEEIPGTADPGVTPEENEDQADEDPEDDDDLDDEGEDDDGQ